MCRRLFITKHRAVYPPVVDKLPVRWEASIHVSCNVATLHCVASSNIRGLWNNKKYRKVKLFIPIASLMIGASLHRARKRQPLDTYCLLQGGRLLSLPLIRKSQSCTASKSHHPSSRVVYDRIWKAKIIRKRCFAAFNWPSDASFVRTCPPNHKNGGKRFKTQDSLLFLHTVSFCTCVRTHVYAKRHHGVTRTARR